MKLSGVLKSRERVQDFLRRHRLGLLTLVFTDLAGSTDLKRVLGDQVGIPLVQGYLAHVRELLAQFPDGTGWHAPLHTHSEATQESPPRY